MQTNIKFLYPKLEQCSSDLLNNILNLNELNKPALGPINNLSFLKTLYNQSVFFLCSFESKTLTSFAVVMDENSNYQSPNYLYFKNKFAQFMYIDRIAVSKDYQRLGIGTIIYSEIYSLSIQKNIPLCCEVNTKPYNKQSLDFHSKNNFQIIEEVPLGNKTVAMMVKN